MVAIITNLSTLSAAKIQNKHDIPTFLHKNILGKSIKKNQTPAIAEASMCLYPFNSILQCWMRYLFWFAPLQSFTCSPKDADIGNRAGAGHHYKDEGWNLHSSATFCSRHIAPYEPTSGHASHETGSATHPRNHPGIYYPVPYCCGLMCTHQLHHHSVSKPHPHRYDRRRTDRGPSVHTDQGNLRKRNSHEYVYHPHDFS